MKNKKREIIIPGQHLGNIKNNKSGQGTFVEKGEIYSEVSGILRQKAGYINVVPLKGRYQPVEDDFIIGIIEKNMSTCWLLDIKSSYPGLLHVSEVPWHVEFGETDKYLSKGDTISARISEVTPENKIDLTMDGPKLRKIKGGQIIEVEPTKIPRIIGKKGSMINLLKQHTKCKFFVGKNGRIWIQGKEEGIEKATKAINIIEKESISYGLTNKIKKLLEKNKL
ncbi:MAG: exosome complex RNA-binding protein Rrp4 [Candidatus Thermoplasmatota archaeon]